MPFPPGDYVRLTVRGIIVGGESWSFSHYQEVTGLVALPAPADLQTCCNNCESHAGLLWTTLKAHCSSAVSFSGLNLAFIRNGVTIFTTVTNEASPSLGTSGTNMPVYISRVVTLLTARAGRSFRGRMYLPYNGTGFSAGAVLWASDATLLTAVKTFITTCTSEVLSIPNAITAGPVIYSNTAGTHEPVTSLRMDNKPDTQRGREKSIVPTIFDTASIP